MWWSGYQWQSHFGEKNVTLMVNPFEIYQHSEATYREYYPVRFGPQPIQRTFAPTVATGIPVIQNVIKCSFGRLFINNVFSFLTQIKSTQLSSGNGVRTHVGIQISNGRLVLTTMFDQIPLEIAYL